MKYLDISRTIATRMKTYHSDPSVEIKKFKSLKMGNSCNLNELTIGSHTGTHVDAPRHIFSKGQGIDSIKFQNLICDICLIDFMGLTIKIILKKIKMRSAKGVIFKNARPGLTMDMAKILVREKMKVIGTDQMSIEKSSDKSHPVHRLLLSNGVTIIEGLDLSKALPGFYRLICLPLKIKNGDGAPARAILIND